MSSSVSKSVKKLSKSAKGLNKSLSKSIDKKLDGPFDKYNFFENIGLDDHCWMEDGVKVRGPGVFCWIVIIWIVTSTLINFLMYDEYRKAGLSNNNIMFRYLLLTIQAFLLSTFIYSMCKRCRGLESILVLVVVSIIQAILALSPFVSNFFGEINKLDGQDKLVVKK